MSSPIGHVIAALAVYQAIEPLTPSDAPRGRKGLFLVGILALLPDLDIVWGWIQGDGTIFHRGFTHSILFAAIIAILGNLIWYKSAEGFKKIGPMQAFLVACLVHPLLDLLMGCGPRVPLFAPFSWRGFQASSQYVPTAKYATRISAIPDVLTDLDALQGMAIELWIFLPLFFAAQSHRSWVARGVLLLLSASALITTYIVYN